MTFISGAEKRHNGARWRSQLSKPISVESALRNVFSDRPLSRSADGRLFDGYVSKHAAYARQSLVK